MARLIPQEDEIRSVSDLAKILRPIKNVRRLLFRGQNVDRPLQPKIARIAGEQSIPYAKITQIERQMLERLKKESLPLLRGVRPQNNWEWLSVAQHQGLPTRLLDWTANALAGLWFAVATDPELGEQGVLWVLEVSPENERSPIGDEDIFSLTRTFVFQPFHIDQRITAQSAWFSVHRYRETQNNFLPLDRNARFKNSLRRFGVPSGRFHTLRQELRLMGVTQATMFPDLSGLCADIQADCIGSWRQLRAI